MMYLSTTDVILELEKRLKGQSPLFAVLGSKLEYLLLGRDDQRWLLTIQEIPAESGNTT